MHFHIKASKSMTITLPDGDTIQVAVQDSTEQNDQKQTIDHLMKEVKALRDYNKKLDALINAMVTPEALKIYQDTTGIGLFIPSKRSGIWQTVGPNGYTDIVETRRTPMPDISNEIQTDSIEDAINASASGPRTVG